jgi:hypothetical protein
MSHGPTDSLRSSSPMCNNLSLKNLGTSLCCNKRHCTMRTRIIEITIIFVFPWAREDYFTFKLGFPFPAQLYTRKRNRNPIISELRIPGHVPKAIILHNANKLRVPEVGGKCSMWPECLVHHNSISKWPLPQEDAHKRGVVRLLEGEFDGLRCPSLPALHLCT